MKELSIDLVGQNRSAKVAIPVNWHGILEHNDISGLKHMS